MPIPSRYLQEAMRYARKFPSRIRKHGPADIPRDPGGVPHGYDFKGLKKPNLDKEINGPFSPVPPASAGPNPFGFKHGQGGIRSGDFNRARSKKKKGAGDMWTGPIGSFPKTYGLNLALGGGAVLGGSAIYKEMKRRGWIK